MQRSGNPTVRSTGVKRKIKKTKNSTKGDSYEGFESVYTRQ